MLLELSIEIGEIVKAAFHSNLHYLLVTANQHFTGIADADLGDIGDNTCSGDALEAGHKVTFT